MPMVKKGATATAPAPTPAAAPVATAPKAAAPTNTDSGTAAAISRLKKKADAPAGNSSPDFKAGLARADETARGKTRCVQFEAALMSPAIAGMKWETMAEYLALCKEAAEFGTAYSFGD